MKSNEVTPTGVPNIGGYEKFAILSTNNLPYLRNGKIQRQLGITESELETPMYSNKR